MRAGNRLFSRTDSGGKMLSRTFFAAAAVLSLSGCGERVGGLDGINRNTIITSIGVTPTEALVPTGSSTQIQPVAFDQLGRPVAGIGGFTFSSGNNGIATVTPGGIVTGVAVGTVPITATLDRGGEIMTATVTITVGDPATTPTVVAGATSNTFTPASLTVSTGATVVWRFGERVHNVDFDAAVGAPADIPSRQNTTVSRRFTTAGTFPYRCTIHTETGTVIVN